MNRYWTLAVTGCLILGFQNCSQRGFSQGSSDGASLQITTPNGGSIDEASTSDPADGAVISAVEIPTNQGDVLTVMADTGHITSSQGEQACLSSADLAELKSYLVSYNLCGSTLPPASADHACTQNYTPGYATLVVNGQNLNLGESFDGCGTGFKDFCGDQAQSFRGLVQYIKKNFAAFSCQ